MRRTVTLLVVLAIAAVGVAVSAAPLAAGVVNIVVPGTAGGPGNGGTAPVSTGIVLGAGKSVVVMAEGTVTLCPPVGTGCANSPDGGNPGNSPSDSLVPNSPFGCLAARVGSGAWACIGSGPTLLSGTGEVQFGVNDSFVSPGVGYEDNGGQFAVSIAVPQASITIRKTSSGVTPPIGLEFPITVECTSTAPVNGGEVGAAADGEIVLVDGNDSGSATVGIAVGGSKTVDVWWPISDLGPVVENVTCTVSEESRVYVGGATYCYPTITPGNSVVLYDLSDEIFRSSASFAVDNGCVFEPVLQQPTFTG